VKVEADQSGRLCHRSRQRQRSSAENRLFDGSSSTYAKASRQIVARALLAFVLQRFVWLRSRFRGAVWPTPLQGCVTKPEQVSALFSRSAWLMAALDFVDAVPKQVGLPRAVM
jgi:hypothetical protein